MATDIELLLATRFHGANNIRGIRYQILYSLLRAFELYGGDAGPTWIRMEGIEDVDLKGIHFENEYVQVKTADKPWAWGELGKPIRGLLAAHRADPHAQLTLAVNFPLRGDIAALTSFHPATTHEQVRIATKFYKLVEKLGVSADEANRLRDHLVILSIPEEILLQKLRLTIAQTFKLGNPAVNTYLLALVAQFLEWAKERKLITRGDLDAVRLTIGEALSRETEFQGYGRGLIDRITWIPDDSPEDFFSGKGTRPGHIEAGLDVQRPRWNQLIDKAVKSAKICVLRTPSGQGKSALLYRYAHDNWAPDNVLTLNAAESLEQVHAIRGYLELLAQLGQPTLVLVDNAGFRTRFWSEVAADCARLGFRMLASVREEDWFRFARESTTIYEVLQPSLDLAEARQIFKAFHSAGRLHESINSAERAYERTGEPHLLLEFVYLLTHGRMLEERLREQERQFAKLGEDPAKLEILRRVTLSHVLGATVDANRLVAQVPLKDDAGQVLKSLTGEYIQITKERVSGLHWVRSDHLVRILHETLPTETYTALAILPAIPTGDLRAYISNALSRPEIDSAQFREGLANHVKELNLKEYLAIVEGVFEAGERLYFEHNRLLFDEVYRKGGEDLLSLVSSGVLPIVKTHALDTVITLLADRGAQLGDIRNRLLESSEVPRGLHAVREFFDATLFQIEDRTLLSCPGDTGRIFGLVFARGNSSAWLGGSTHEFR